MKLQIEVRLGTNHWEAIGSCMRTLVLEFHKPGGITARQAVINILECTNLVPGIFNVHMLSWRQRLHEMLFDPKLTCPFAEMNYQLPLAVEVTNGTPLTRTIGTQTTLTNPNGSDLLEFNMREHRLQWVLYDPK